MFSFLDLFICFYFILYLVAFFKLIISEAHFAGDRARENDLTIRNSPNQDMVASSKNMHHQ